MASASFLDKYLHVSFGNCSYRIIFLSKSVTYCDKAELRQSDGKNRSGNPSAPSRIHSQSIRTSQGRVLARSRQWRTRGTVLAGNGRRGSAGSRRRHIPALRFGAKRCTGGRNRVWVYNSDRRQKTITCVCVCACVYGCQPSCPSLSVDSPPKKLFFER